MKGRIDKIIPGKEKGGKRTCTESSPNDEETYTHGQWLDGSLREEAKSRLQLQNWVESSGEVQTPVVARAEGVASRDDPV